MFQLKYDWTGHYSYYQHILWLTSNIIADDMETDEESLNELWYWVKQSKNTIDLSDTEVSGRMAKSALNYDSKPPYVSDNFQIGPDGAYEEGQEDFIY